MLRPFPCSTLRRGTNSTVERERSAYAHGPHTRLHLPNTVCRNYTCIAGKPVSDGATISYGGDQEGG